MEGAESGALAPSDTITEFETWAKFSNFPAEFLTSDALGMIASSIGSPVMMDEDTFEKLENHKWHPKLRRKLHSSITFVRALVRVSVTEPLRPTVAVFCPQGRKFIIRIDYDPTPKICRNCWCAGHFDFECCGIVKESVESLVDDAVAVEDVLGGDFQLADCCDSMNDEVDGEQGAVTIDGVESFEDSSVVEAVFFPAATCNFDDAQVGELAADITLVDVVLEQSLVERTAAVLEVQPLPPATTATDGSEGTVFCDGFVCYEGPPVVEAVLEATPLCLPPVSCVLGAAKAGDLEAVQSFSDSVDDEPLVGKEIAADLPDSVGDSLAADLHELAAEPISVDLHEEPSLERIAAVPCLIEEQLAGFFVLSPFELWPFCMLQFSVVHGPRNHHKWRDKSVVLGLLCDTLDGQGLFPFVKLDLLQMLPRLGAVFIDWAVCYGDPPDFEAALVEDFHNFEQGFFVVKSFTTHHKWRDKSEMQGFSCISFDDLFLLQTFLVATFLDQLIFKIQHKWRDKGLLISLLFLMLKKKKKKKKKKEKSEIEEDWACCNMLLDLLGCCLAAPDVPVLVLAGVSPSLRGAAESMWAAPVLE